MQSDNKLKSELLNPMYLPVIKDSSIYYGGSQMWFPTDRKYSRDYVLHNYGCGTIATADLFLYLALQNKAMKTPVTEIALHQGNPIKYENYQTYIRLINNRYTKTKPIIAVLGIKIASVINDYSDTYGLGYQASWQWKLTYYDMLDMMEEMLSKDIPVILSIGPNTPKLWGKKGISFYTIRVIEYLKENSKLSDHTELSDTKHPTDTIPNPPELSDVKQPTDTAPNPPTEGPIKKKKPYYYKVEASDVNGHYVTVTGIIKDEIANRIMLRISSWGKLYYINYEEYRDYIESYGGTFTSSIVRLKRI